MTPPATATEQPAPATATEQPTFDAASPIAAAAVTTAEPDVAALPTALPALASTASKIESAQASGALSAPTAWLYKVYSAFDPAQLPAQFRGDDLIADLNSINQPSAAQLNSAWTGTLTKARVALASAAQNWDAIPAETQAKLQPYIQRPSNEQSFWYNQLFTTTTSSRVNGLASPAQASSTFDYVDVVKAPVRVWFIKDSSGDNKALAAKLAAEIDSSGMWDKEKAVMGQTPCSDASLSDNGGDGRFDFYIVPANKTIKRKDWDGDKALLPGDPNSDYTTYGLTIPEDSVGDCPSADFTLLNEDQDFNSLSSTTAHELFHAFQDSFPLKDEDASAWWAESTAVWAEDMVYPTLDEEQSQLQDGGWARNSDQLGPLDLWQDDGLAQYGSYIWPFYLTHRPGGSASIIASIYKASANETPLQAMYAMPDWSARFKEFALWDWNWAPVDVYRDHGQHIDPLIQTPTKLGNKGTISNDNPSGTVKLNLKETQIGYYEVLKIDDGSNNSDFVHQFKVDISSLTGQSGAGVQAIIWLADGSSHVEDWSTAATKTYCRDTASQQITKLVLVVTNGNIKASQKLRGHIDVDAVPTSCR